MKTIKEHLRAIYLDPLKEETELYIGVELEFPIVNRKGGATDPTVSKALLQYLADEHDFIVEQTDEDGYPVQLRNLATDDRVLFEVSYNILEMAFGKVNSIPEVDRRFQTYLAIIQGFLHAHHHELQGQGIHPSWDKNDNSPVKLPRYRMLMAYLALADDQCHPFVDYGAFICGNQVQLDVTKSNYLRVLNAFNQIEPAKAYLFANSTFSDADWDTTIARDLFWENSMHGLIPENVGVYPSDFTDQDNYLDFLTRTAMFTVTRETETYYFLPQVLTSYFTQQTIEAYDWHHNRYLLEPQATDLSTHRSYHYQTLTRRGTVEFRSVCTQPLELTFASTAFHLGLLENLAELEAYLEQADFFTTYGRDYPALRRQFSKKSLDKDEKNKIREFSKKLLEIARSGLGKRQFSEGIYLENLIKRKKL